MTGDGSLGWPEDAPYDVILAAATGPGVPDAWLAQLAEGGRIVMPIGRARAAPSTSRRSNAQRDGRLDETNLGGVSFVPLVGEQAWPGN